MKLHAGIRPAFNNMALQFYRNFVSLVLTLRYAVDQMQFDETWIIVFPCRFHWIGSLG